ncbi:uncharacterized protein ACRADG_008149 [Cochliomyia hominivorax]
MNCIHNKMILYMLIIASGIDFILPWPTFNDYESKNVEPKNLPTKRIERQIVQPTWLTLGQESPIDPTVHVNDKALKEAAEIRKAIQTAVDEDIYVVQQPDPNTAAETVKPPTESNPPERPFSPIFPSMQGLPNWYVHMQNLWRNWSQNLFKGFQIQ